MNTNNKERNIDIPNLKLFNVSVDLNKVMFTVICNLDGPTFVMTIVLQASFALIFVEHLAER